MCGAWHCFLLNIDTINAALYYSYTTSSYTQKITLLLKYSSVEFCHSKTILLLELKPDLHRYFIMYNRI